MSDPFLGTRTPGSCNNSVASVSPVLPFPHAIHLAHPCSARSIHPIPPDVIAYYSSVIFTEAGASPLEALGASLGWGALNFVFGFPASTSLPYHEKKKKKFREFSD